MIYHGFNQSQKVRPYEKKEKIMKTIIKPAIVLFFAVILCNPGLVFAGSTTPLVAGQHITVGYVEVSNNGVTLYVKYVIDADLTPDDPTDDGVPSLITQTHLSVTTEPGNIPQKKGNPIPGKFEYKEIHDPGVSEFTYKIPLADYPGEPLYIAAHAVVEKLSGLDGLEAALPGTVQMKV
jgi:hypothetical protein